MHLGRASVSERQRQLRDLGPERQTETETETTPEREIETETERTPADRDRDRDKTCRDLGPARASDSNRAQLAHAAPPH